MELIPVTRAEVESGIIRVDEARRQRIGVKTARAELAPMELSIRALGRVTYDEKALVDITLKLDGYIHELRVSATGERVKKGDVLFTLYSPELYAAQQEYLLARNSQSAANASLVGAARKRLELWGLTSAQIERIAQGGEPVENMPFLALASGYVIEKNVVEGAAVKAGERLFRIAPLEKVWVEADVYEQDLPQVKPGQPVEVTLPYLPGKKYTGRVGYIYPALEEKTRTGRIRIELPNPGLELKPEMYADVRFIIKAGERLQVPASAVLYTGPRRLVFVDLGEGRLKPQEVKLGLKGEDTYEIVEGLKPGDVVVTSGNFLIAAESRIRSATDSWTGDDHAGP
jgi:Cu(I)/Ag(I) efflux system membrane fusion protein